MWTGQNNDLPFSLFLPSFTATAWYHHELPEDLQSRSLEDVLAEVERFATNDYLLALVKGDTLSDQEREQVDQMVARYTGLSEEYVDNSELRVQIHRVCKELLRHRKLTVGRIDSRYTGIDVLAVTDVPDYDPSMAETNAPFTSVFNAYVRDELGYKSDRKYETLNGEVNKKWKFDHLGEGRGSRTGYLDTTRELRKAMVRNPYLQVLVAYGYYDLATPYYAIKYTVDHLGLRHKEPERSLRDNVHYASYEAGHMMYVDDVSRRKLRDDVFSFIRESLAAVPAGTPS
jgi:carboxypeptidase C (cathepsin A)